MATRTDRPRRLRRGGPWAAAAVVLLILCTVATAKGGDPKLYPPKAGDEVTIFLVDNGFHTDLAIPRAVLAAGSGVSARVAAEVVAADPWVLVGWGDEEFYEGEGLSLNRVAEGLGALAGVRGRTVVHYEGLAAAPDVTWHEGVRPLHLSKAGLAAMVARLDASFALGPGGAPIIEPVQREASEAFFRSREGFSAVHVCNHWTAELLSAAGLPTTPVLDTVPAGLELDLKVRAHV